MPRLVVPAAAAALLCLALAAPGRAAESPCRVDQPHKAAAPAAVVPCEGPMLPCLPAQRPCQD
ncbi:MAG: hypothetical protein ACKN89_03370 [Cyanobium sp.]